MTKMMRKEKVLCEEVERMPDDYDLWHVSLVPVKNFVPKIPEYRAPGENDTIPRICTSVGIEQCIDAMPCSGYPIAVMLEMFSIKPTLYVYRFKRSGLDFTGLADNRVRVVDSQTLQARKLVPDASTTKEHWLLDYPIYVEECIYEVDSIEYEEIESNKSILHVSTINMVMNPNATDNTTKLLSLFKQEKRKKLQQIVDEYGIRQVLYELVDAFHKMQGDLEKKNIVNVTQS